jgi:hypothetical protein
LKYHGMETILDGEEEEEDKKNYDGILLVV